MVEFSQWCVFLCNLEEFLQPKCPRCENLPHSTFFFFFVLLLQVSSLRGEKKKELGGSWSCVGLPFTPSVELKPSLRFAYTLHNTRFGLSSLFSGAAVGLAMATTTSGIRHFIRPPLSAANWLCFYKQASSQPANTRWHSLISVSPDRRNTYGGKERKDPNRNLLISTAFFAVFFFLFFLQW